MEVVPNCGVCLTPTHHAQATLCRRCKKIVDRVETRKGPDGRGRRVDKQARRKAMQKSFRNGRFHCFYTGVELVEDDWPNYRYLTFEHLTPGEESEVVVASALINRMKTDLTEVEFRRLMPALAKALGGAEFDEGAFPLHKPRVPDEIRPE